MTGPSPTGHSTNLSTLAVVGGVVAIVALLTAAALYLTGDDALQRLAVVAALAAPTTVGLLALVRSDQAVTQTNGTNAALAATNTHLRDNLAQTVQAAVIQAVAQAGSTPAAQVIPAQEPPTLPPVLSVDPDGAGGLG